MSDWKFGVPCHHAGCDRHISHPCEVCGRVGAKWTVIEMYDLIGNQAQQLATSDARAGRLARVVRAVTKGWKEESEALNVEHEALGYSALPWKEFYAAWKSLLPGDRGEEG